MKNLTSKLLILSVFFSINLYAVAGDTIRYVDVSSHISFAIKATPNKQFTVRCVDYDVEQIFIGTEEYVGLTITMFVSGYVPYEVVIEGEEGCAFTAFVAIKSSVMSIDLSRCTSIQRLGAGTGQFRESLKDINLSNCVNLDTIQLIGGVITDLDLSDCRALKVIYCINHHLSVLDINLTNNPAIYSIACYYNHLPLSNLYALSELSDEQFPPFRFGKQTERVPRRIKPGDALDYSSQKEFGGLPTGFAIVKGYENWGADPNSNYADPNTYDIENGVITFHKAGKYTVDMRNNAIRQDYWFMMLEPARYLVWIDVIDFVPVTEITNIPASATVGEVVLSNRIVLPANATYTYTTWEIIDAGTTGATLTGSRLNTTATGFVIVRGTIKDGLDFDEDYTQDFVIEIKPLGIEEGAELSGITVYPNPTTGELRIENGELRIINVEIVDVYGRILLTNHLITSSSNHLINIAHLPAGNYFVKIITEEGEIVKKVVKQ